MNPSNELLKQIYSLSFSVNSASNLSWEQTDCKSGMVKMQAYVKTVAAAVLSETTSIIGNWKAVWGPIVYANDPTSNSVHADNTMGMYYNADENVMVIGIAGTNVNSPFGWLVEDFSVHTTKSWETITGVPSSGNISHGTYVGLSILRNMKDHEGETVITALKNFLKKNPMLTGMQIAVAGHSLGGALSPTLALFLSDTKSEWDANGITSIGAFPTAGPTPGDEAFASYYEKQIAASKIYYLSQHNAIDVVPHAWQKEDLEKIPTIYEDYIKQPSDANPSETITGTLASAAALNALATKNIIGVPVNRYQQISPSTTLNGTFDTEMDDTISKKLEYIGLVLPTALGKYAVYLRNLARFAAQAAVQHTSEYHTLLDIVPFMTAYKKILTAHQPKDQVVLEDYEYAVKEIVKIDLKKIDEAALAIAKDNAN
ncbi:lipase family protein [Kordia sp.]|uniref:lipase family protein n=1 Tax=Kordia sp. TaxID=1965332 RepID=UPI003D2AAA0D